MGNDAGGPSEGGQPVGGRVVANSRPLRERVLVVVSQLGWYEVYGDADVAFVEHRIGETDEDMAKRVRYGYRELLTGEPIQAGDATILIRRPPKGNGWLDNARHEHGRLVMAERLNELVERYGHVMDRHPLLWLDEIATVAGMEPLDMLHALLRAGREKDAATKKNAAQGKQWRAAKNTHQEKAKTP